MPQLLLMSPARSVPACERHADGIADAAKKERADAAAALDEPRPLGARLRHADVERIVRPFRTVRKPPR